MSFRDAAPRITAVRSIRTASLFAIGALSMVGSPASAQSDLPTFYATAQATITSPPSEDSLSVRCAQELRSAENAFGAKGWVSFLTPPRDTSAWIAAFTTRRIRSVGDALSTTVRFSPLPTAKPVSSATLDWAYVWDRNGDGRVDYIAYLQNAMGVLPDPLPDSFPKPTPNADGSFRVTAPFLHALIDNAAMVFRHYADDDFDGRIDGVVFEEFDEARPMFVRRWIVARTSGDAGTGTRAWAFRQGIADTLETVTVDAGERFAHGTKMMAAINEIHARCGLARTPIRRP